MSEHQGETSIPAIESGLAAFLPGPLKLRVVGTARHGQAVQFATERVSIGSAPNCTLRLRSTRIQPLQCLILRQPSGATVRSLAGDNWLNGKPFLEEPLRTGDRLRIGTIELEICETGVAAPVAPNQSDELRTGEPSQVPPHPSRDSQVTPQSARCEDTLPPTSAGENAATTPAATPTWADVQGSAEFLTRILKLEQRLEMLQACEQTGSDTGRHTADQQERQQWTAELERSRHAHDAAQVRYEEAARERDALRWKCEELERRHEALNGRLESLQQAAAIPRRPEYEPLSQESLDQLQTEWEQRLQSLTTATQVMRQELTSRSQQQADLLRYTNDLEAELVQERAARSDLVTELARERQVRGEMETRLQQQQSEFETWRDRCSDLEEKLAAALQTPPASPPTSSPIPVPAAVSLATQSPNTELPSPPAPSTAPPPQRRQELNWLAQQLGILTEPTAVPSPAAGSETAETEVSSASFSNSPDAAVPPIAGMPPAAAFDTPHTPETSGDQIAPTVAGNSPDLFAGLLDPPTYTAEELPGTVPIEEPPPVPFDVLPDTSAIPTTTEPFSGESAILPAAAGVVETTEATTSNESAEDIIARLAKAGIWREDNPEAPAMSAEPAAGAAISTAVTDSDSVSNDGSFTAGVTLPGSVPGTNEAGDRDHVNLTSELILGEPGTSSTNAPPEAGNARESENGSREEESIELYMQRLLERVRGESHASRETYTAPQPPVRPEPVVAAPVTPTDAEPTTPTAPPAASPSVLKECDYLPRSHAPEANINLAAMRALANDNRHAQMRRHAEARCASKSVNMFIGTVAGVGTAVASFFLLETHTKLAAGGLLAGMSIAGYWSWQIYRVRQQLLDELRLDVSPQRPLAGPPETPTPEANPPS